MTVILKEDQLRLIKKVKSRAFKIHLLGVLLTLCVLSITWIHGLESGIVRESYKLFKGQVDSLIFRQQLYTLLRTKPLTVGQALDVADAILGQDRVPVSLALAMISVESDFDPGAVSYKGAKGLTQVMPIIKTIYAKHPSFGKEINQVHEVSVNVKLGLMYLGDLYERFKDWKKALRAYNAGPENADNKKFDGYANTVLKRAKDFEIKG